MPNLTGIDHKVQSREGEKQEMDIVVAQVLFPYGSVALGSLSICGGLDTRLTCSRQLGQQLEGNYSNRRGRNPVFVSFGIFHIRIFYVVFNGIAFLISEASKM